ncbi:MAG TPA: DUF6352 family protein [Xanthobacteraceae bacterium]|nr:DUF6352 family protein [Xanthobacteraceae bacterium]
MKDFWLSCGHHLLDRDAQGRLTLTDDFLKVYLARPELAPPADACDAERMLHAALMKDPRRPVRADEITAIADADARENWQQMIAFRDHLVAHDTVEGAYLAMVRQGQRVPLLFLDQLVHVILRNALDGIDDVYFLRSAELLFRPQRLTVHEGALIAADEERLGGAAQSPLVAMLGLPPAGDVDVLNNDNAATYWERSDSFDMALDLSAGRRGLAALAAVLERWIAHLLGIAVAVVPVAEPGDVALSWYVGLDAEATRLGDALWRGDALDPDEGASIIAVFRVTFNDQSQVLEQLAGEPIYLILAMNAERMLRMKPQNLLTGLPIRQPTVLA